MRMRMRPWYNSSAAGHAASIFLNISSHKAIGFASGLGELGVRRGLGPDFVAPQPRARALRCNSWRPRRPVGGPWGKLRLGSRVMEPGAALFSGREFRGKRGRTRDPESGHGPSHAQRDRHNNALGMPGTPSFHPLTCHTAKSHMPAHD
ncbi:hypothetical protein NDU88_009112 [Pleurodeles waltl]|uniref:Uncharacterized protein n=1 Tax=Pleurodeles waltl TaxID=8319 RepID=A0AAV7PU73_PLEWA|nr:hypothetical protein NDU88_009112 [Pleurodeles waltl]